MKQLLLSLMTCCMCVSAFAQIDTAKKIRPGNSDKWVILKGNSKNGFNKLFVTLPKGTAWDITIYAAGSEKVISNTMLKTTFTLLPGSYDLEINHIKITGVPVEKGNNTRLKAGVLQITTSGAWTLYDETKETVLINTYSVQTRGLPVGKYILTSMGQDRNIEIKDSEKPVRDDAPDDLTIDAEQYTMTPVPVSLDTAMQSKGRIVTEFPMANQGMTQNIYYFLWIRRPGVSASVFYCRGNYLDHCPETYSLAEGLYDVGFGVDGDAETNNPIIVSNVPVKKGYETRLKVGYLDHKFRGIYHVFDESMGVKYLSYDFQLSPPPIPLPVGNYTVNMPNVGNFNVQIKDGIKTLQSPIDSSPERPRWTITPLTKIGITPLKTKSGRIISQFPGSDTLKFLLHIPRPDGTAYTNVTLDTLQYYDTRPGIYTAELNNAPVEFPVEQGKQTQIKFGFMTLGPGNWTLTDLVSGKAFNYGINSGYHKRALPIGFYIFKPMADAFNKLYLIKINEGETLNPVLSY